MTNPNDITAFRKKKKKRKNIFKLVILIVLLGLFTAVYFFRDEIFEPLRGIASQINNTTTTDEGFPVQLPGSASYKFSALGDNFLLLTDTYLYTYTTGGKQIFALQHGFVNPIEKTNSKRVLVFDKGAHKFAMYNKTSEIYNVTIEDDTIVSAFISNSERVAVVTSGSRYSNILYVYDGNGKRLYTRKFVNENVMQVAFTPDEQNVIVTTITAANGEVVTNIYKYDINTDNSEIWKYTVNDTITLDVSINNDTATVFGDNKTFCLNTTDGTEIGSYSFSKEVEQCKTSGILTAMLFKDSTTNKNVLVTLDESCQVLSSLAVGVDIAQIQIEGEKVYTLEGSSIICYNKNLKIEKELPLEEEYSAFVKVGNKILLLGYNVVQEADFS